MKATTNRPLLNAGAYLKKKKLKKGAKKKSISKYL